MGTLLERIAQVHKELHKTDNKWTVTTIDDAFIKTMLQDEQFCARVGDVFLNAVYSKLDDSERLSGLLRTRPGKRTEKPSHEAIRIRQRLCMEEIEKNYSDLFVLGRLQTYDHQQTQRLEALLNRAASSPAEEHTQEYHLKRFGLSYKAMKPEERPNPLTLMAKIGQAVIVGGREHYREKVREAPMMSNYKRFLEYQKIEQQLSKA